MNPMVVVGDALLDRDVDGRAERLCPDAPAPVVSDLRTRSRPGGAALAATLAARDGRDVTLVTAVADDAVGHELLTLLAETGVETINLGCTAPTAEKVRVRVAGHTLLRMDRGGPGCGKVGTLIQPAQRALDAGRRRARLRLRPRAHGPARHPRRARAAGRTPGRVGPASPRGASRSEAPGS